jgi:hypothetical protein
MKTAMQKIIETKREARRKIIALPIEEKLRILDQLRDELLVGLASQRAGERRERFTADR